MTDFIEGLEHDLVEAAARRYPAGTSPRRTLRSVLLGLAIFLGISGPAAVATAVVLRNTVIEPPATADAGREQTPVPDSEVVSALRAADPGGEPPWTIRVARGQTGLVCTTVGQVSGGAFGLVGTDGQFRTLAPGVVDACGLTQPGSATLMGTRVLAAAGDDGVRTVLNGIAGPGLRTVAVTVAGKRTALPVGAGGTFVAAYRGYPETLRIEVELGFAGGHTERRTYGVADGVVPDPAGGPAWSVGGVMSLSDRPEACVQFTPARVVVGGEPRSPLVCGLPDAPAKGDRDRRGVFFALRRLSDDTVASQLGGSWSPKLPRTALWGFAGGDVRSVTVLGAPGGPQRVPIPPNRALLAVLPASVDPASLSVRVRFADGRTATYHGDTNLVPTPAG